MRRGECHLRARCQWDPGDGLVGYAGRIPIAASDCPNPRASAIRGQGHIHRGRRLLRPQRCRRRCRRCSLDVPARRATGAPAVDAVGRTCMGAARPRDGAHAERRPRFKGQLRRVESHGVFAAAQQSTGRRRQPARRPGNGAHTSVSADRPGQCGDAQRPGELLLPGDEAERQPRAALHDHQQWSRGLAIGEHAPAFFRAAQSRGHVELLCQRVVH